MSDHDSKAALASLRHVKLEFGYTLQTWDTGRRDWRGQSVIAYEFTKPDGEILFSGEDFCGSPMHADDSDETLRALLSFLTMRPGDTDREYFDKYDEKQREFAESSECEMLQLYATDGDDNEAPSFENLDDFEGE